MGKREVLSHRDGVGIHSQIALSLHALQFLLPSFVALQGQGHFSELRRQDFESWIVEDNLCVCFEHSPPNRTDKLLLLK